MDPETPNQPLITGSAAVNEPPNGGRSTRAYKVAGITLLACVLIAGQVMTAYFLLAQKGEIKSLEEQGNKLKSVMTNGRSASGSEMVVPANSFVGLYDATMDKDTASEEKGNPATDCQLRAIGLKSTELPGFHPACDERGLYQAEQCFRGQCWCVSPDGQVISGSMRSGRASCATAVRAGSMSRAMSVPE